MIAIVENGVFKHTTSAATVKTGDYVVPTALPLEERKQYGMYDFVSAVEKAPEGKKPQGTKFTVDDEAGTVTETLLYVDLTADEIKASNNGPVLAEIQALEKEQLLPRILRDLVKKSLEEDAAKEGITLESLYEKASEPDAPGPALAYKKFKDFDDACKVLRYKLVA